VKAFVRFAGEMTFMTTENLSSTASPDLTRSKDQSEFFAQTCGILSALAFAIACFLYAVKSNEAQWGFVSAIFFLPLPQVLAVIYTLPPEPRVHGAKVLLPSLFVQLVLWMAYSCRESYPRFLQPLAWCALACAVALAILALWVTRRILQEQRKKDSTLRTLLQAHPFMVTCFFLTMFTFEALFLSLALAFHDQGLRLENKGIGLFAGQLVDAPRPAQDAPPPGEAPTRPFRILFEPGSAVIKVDDKKYKSVKEEQQIEWVASQGQLVAANTLKLRDALAQIQRTSELDRVRVVLEGHSNEWPVGEGTYKSNFELSQARVNQVMAYLLTQLGNSGKKEWRRNIEWQTLFCPDERPPGKSAADKQPQPPDPKRLSVEISVLSYYGDKTSSHNNLDHPLGRPLSLLDYTYFGMYTITTTGYGDIVPVTAFAKFVPMVANFFHVFMIVVFFNVLISFLLGQGGEGLRTSAP
jgi:outer membrane protein OmpA-like peptidoglycan-associated protein